MATSEKLISHFPSKFPNGILLTHLELSISPLYLYISFQRSIHQQPINSSSSSSSSSSSMESHRHQQRSSPVEFEDLMPAMAERLGGEGLMEELCNGFRLLMDPSSGLITFDSLKSRSASSLGLGGMSDEELMGMLREGDADGDGALDVMEFCVLMLRLSPAIMDEAWGQIMDMDMDMDLDLSSAS